MSRRSSRKVLTISRIIRSGLIKLIVNNQVKLKTKMTLRSARALIPMLQRFLKHYRTIKLVTKPTIQSPKMSITQDKVPFYSRLTVTQKSS